jgi:hypothetical protein
LTSTHVTTIITIRDCRHLLCVFACGAGPTNSGKTYNALQSLAIAGRGVYCAPLRLLAMEVYETLNHMGVYCDLVSLKPGVKLVN